MVVDDNMDAETPEELKYEHFISIVFIVLTPFSEGKKRKETCPNEITNEPAAPLMLNGQPFNVTVEEREESLVLDAEMPMLNLETLIMAVDDETRVLTISGDKTSPSRKRARAETNNVNYFSSPLLPT